MGVFIDEQDSFDEAKISVAAMAGGDLDAIAQLAHPDHAFLRSAWTSAATPPAACGQTIFRHDGTQIATIPLVGRGRRWLPIRQVAGPYWPFRSFPIAADTSDGEFAAMLRNAEVRKALGPVWRLGPVYAGDSTATRLMRLGRASGWTVIPRASGTIFELDLKALTKDGPWPKGKTRRKNRNRERRLAEIGDLEYRTISGCDWSEADLDAFATIESNSWLAKLAGGGDTKFLDPGLRKTWQSIARDPILAKMLFAQLMTIGNLPAAFTFGLEVDKTRYYIANNYDERFAKFGAGKILLYRDFEHAAAAGIETISWGVGDAGYKSEMGAQAGPAVLDLLIVKNRLLASVLRPFWRRSSEQTDG
jgi:CelD/BcsL family acetyltransferase involved in cellulose biosynthesis